jgi:tetratricopeptide (TPR) repeat protein
MLVSARFGLLAIIASLAGLAPAASLAQGMGDRATPAARGPAYDPNAEFHAGADALAAGKYRAAKQNFEHVLLMVRDQPAALYLLAQAEAGLGDWRGAVRDDEASLRVDPNQVFAARDLAIAEQKLGRHDQAVSELEKLKARATACGESCSEAGDLQGAVRDVEAAVASAKTPAG